MKYPYDEEAEKAVLSCILIDNELADYGCSVLKSEDFCNPKNQAVFCAIEKLNADNVEIDVVTINTQVEKNPVFSEGSIKWISLIAGHTSTSLHFKSYLKIVKEKSYCRRVMLAADQMKQKALSGDIDTICSSMEEIQNTGLITPSMKSMDIVLQKALDDVAENIRNGVRFTGLLSGFSALDFMTGGFQSSELIILAARPGMGKTSLALDILQNSTVGLKKSDKIGLFFSLEMEEKSVLLRMYSSALGIKNERFKFGTLTKEDIALMERKAPETEKKLRQLYISDNMGVNLSDLYTTCYTQRSQSGKEIGIICVDYLQLIEEKKENRTQELSTITRGLKRLAKEFHCPVLALSQLSRRVEERADKRPILSDLRESGSIEQDADIVLFLYRDDYYYEETEKKNIAELHIAKHRNGPTGVIELAFLKETTSFRNLEKIY